MRQICDTIVHQLSEMENRLHPLYPESNDDILGTGKVHNNDTLVIVLTPRNGKIKRASVVMCQECSKSKCVSTGGRPAFYVLSGS